MMMVLFHVVVLGKINQHMVSSGNTRRSNDLLFYCVVIFLKKKTLIIQ